MAGKKKLTGYPIRSMGIVWLLIMCLCVSCTSDTPSENSSAAETAPVTETPDIAEGSAPVTEAVEPDTEGPVISGVKPLTALVGGTLNYRDGVTAVDDRDGPVPIQVDSSKVNLNVAGEYEVVYFAEDSSGNRTEVATTAVITEPGSTENPTEGLAAADLERLNALADQILEQITDDSMSLRDKAKAIYDYVSSHIKYVGSSDKSSWIAGAYSGFTTGRGDCFNYFACAKTLLTRAGIPNVDLERVGGVTHHYWQLVNVGDGYYHFDTCPHPSGYGMTSFLITEDQARAYTEKIGSVRPNYYVYDYASCPVPVVGLSEEERNPQGADAAGPGAQPEGQEG